MRNAFEAWAQRDGHIVRRREDKPDEYLVYETQRRWMIWQAALTHGETAAETPSKFAAQQGAAKAETRAARSQGADEAAVRAQVLGEVLEVLGQLDDSVGLAGARKAVQHLKATHKVLAEEKQ
jgi:hypothetical protein